MIDIIHKATGKLVRQYPDEAIEKAKEFVKKFIKKGWVILSQGKEQNMEEEKTQAEETGSDTTPTAPAEEADKSSEASEETGSEAKE